MKELADTIVYALVRGFFWGVGLLPRSLAYRVCHLLADLVYCLDGRHRHIALVNLRIAFPERDDRWRRRLIRRSFCRLGEHVVELSRVSRRKWAEFSRRVRYEPERGLQHYLEAKEEAGSVLFLTAHIGPWEILPLAHALHGHPLSFLVRPLDNPRLESWLKSLRRQFGNEVIPKRNSMRRILRSLRRGEDVGFLIDQNAQESEGVFVPLFGHSACTSSGLASLALKSGLPVVPGFILPDGGLGRYRIRFYPALSLGNGNDQQHSVLEATARFNEIIEEVIREFPDCWLWGHRRFRTQPDRVDLYGQN